ncbi:glycosyltransferase family 2 protein [Candidatus Parcubacteria bacterium]|nr:glycosyltransferase family 2 protein [Patescibacteria group bacterium]MCG2688411.1 glycosyltransferase family 2 protein [Candidatus Parcubacteria bacterium]
MKLSIIIPVFNEEKTIKKVLESVLKQDIGNWEKEIIVIDDHSNDDTAEILKQFLDRIKIFQHGKNLGKGSALRTGFGVATGEAIIIQDADLEYSPDDWPKMLAELEKSSDISAVFGSREMNPERKGYWHYVLGVRFLAFLINFLFKSNLTDPYTCYKLFRAELIKGILLESNGFEIEAEMTVKILKQGGKIKEVPINYYPRKFSEGKKIRVKDGLVGIWTIIRYWLK